MAGNQECLGGSGVESEVGRFRRSQMVPVPDVISGRGQNRGRPPCLTAAAVLSVTPLEQVLGSCLEALGAEQFEAEGVGEPVGRVERGADRQRVLDLLA